MPINQEHPGYAALKQLSAGPARDTVEALVAELVQQVVDLEATLALRDMRVAQLCRQLQLRNEGLTAEDVQNADVG